VRTRGELLELTIPASVNGDGGESPIPGEVFGRFVATTAVYPGSIRPNTGQRDHQNHPRPYDISRTVKAPARILVTKMGQDGHDRA